MRRIVVATDMSERSDRAIARALRLSSDLNAECVAISIVDDSLPEDTAAATKASAETDLRSMLDDRGAADVTIDIRFGDVVPGILGLAAEHEADLLIMGLHRRRDVLDNLRQTTMERVVAMSSRPVLLVRDPADSPYRSVLVAVAFSRACARAVSAANRIAPGAEVAAFHALHVPFVQLAGGERSSMAQAAVGETEELAAAWTRQYGVLGAPPEVVPGGFREVLERQIASARPQLLAIGAHTRSGIGLHALGSSTAALMRDPPTDLLVALG